MKKDWNLLPFEKCIRKIPKQKQIKAKDYSDYGCYPIVSQESGMISGYSDDGSLLFVHDKPIVIFGDHTKVVKYIDFDFVVGADGTHILMPIDSIDSKFFYYAISSISLDNLGYARHYKLLKDKKIPVPPLPEQQKIVDYLDSAFAKIDQLKANAEKQLEDAQSLFSAALEEAMSPKEGWEEKTLGEICSKIGSGATPKGGKKVYIEKGVSLVRSMNVRYGFFDNTELAHINDEAASKLDGVTLNKDDVLFNITGASIARCCVLPDDVLPARVNQHVCILRIKDGTIPQFLCYCLNSKSHQKELLAIGEAASTRQALTKADMEKHLIMLPNKATQQSIVSHLDALSAKVNQLKENYKSIVSECDALKQALLREIFE